MQSVAMSLRACMHAWLQLEIPADRAHFDIVVACEDEDGNDLDVPLVSIRFR